MRPPRKGMKCHGCKAFDEILKYCQLGYDINWKQINSDYIEARPAEWCPKPTTLKKFINTPKKVSGSPRQEKPHDQ